MELNRPQTNYDYCNDRCQCYYKKGPDGCIASAQKLRKEYCYGIGTLEAIKALDGTEETLEVDIHNWRRKNGALIHIFDIVYYADGSEIYSQELVFDTPCCMRYQEMAVLEKLIHDINKAGFKGDYPIKPFLCNHNRYTFNK